MNKYLSQFSKCLGLAGVAFFVVAAASSAWAAAARTKIIVVVPHRILFTVALPVYIAQEKGFYRDANHRRRRRVHPRRR